MATGPDSHLWSLEHVNRQLTGHFLKPLDEYNAKVLDALLNHLPDALKREGIRRAQNQTDIDWDETHETGDPEWDEMERAIRAGVDPSTLPSWQNGGDNV